MKTWVKNISKMEMIFSIWIKQFVTPKDGRFYTSKSQKNNTLSSLKKNVKSVFNFLVIFVSLSSALMVSSQLHANSLSVSKGLGNYSTGMIVNCVIGEAANQNLVGMIAVSEAIRNRGHLKGVVGCGKEDFVSTQPEEIKRLAAYAWEESANTNITKGADHWGNKEDVKHFRKTEWFARMEKTAEIGQHQFFKVRHQ